MKVTHHCHNVLLLGQYFLSLVKAIKYRFYCLENYLTA